MYQSIMIALLSGLRSRIFQTLLGVGVLAMGAAYLASTFSPRQPESVALDIGLSLVRAVMLLLVLYWAYELVGKEIERRTIFVSLSYPVSRTRFLLGRYFGALILVVMAVSLLGVLLAMTTWSSGLAYVQSNPATLKWPYVFTLIMLVFDLAVVLAFGFAVSSVSVTPFVPMITGMAFAVSARSLGPALEYLAAMTPGQGELKATMTPVFEWVKWVLPDLSRLDIRYYALYSHQPDYAVLAGGALMATGYAGLLLAIAIWRFNRRQFN